MSSALGDAEDDGSGEPAGGANARNLAAIAAAASRLLRTFSSNRPPGAGAGGGGTDVGGANGLYASDGASGSGWAGPCRTPIVAIAARRRKASSPVCGADEAGTIGLSLEGILSPGILSPASPAAGADGTLEEGGTTGGDDTGGGVFEADGVNVGGGGANAGAGEANAGAGGTKAGSGGVNAGAGAGAMGAAGRSPIDIARRR